MTALALHYSSMQIFDAIFVLWANQTYPDTFAAFLESTLHKKVSLIRTNDDLNERFAHFHMLKTECVFIMDDDIFVEERTLEQLYKVWSKHKKQIVGLWPRAHGTEEGSGKYISEPRFAYSMVLTKFMVLDADYLSQYTLSMPRAIQNYVRTKRNCEDIAINMLVSNATGLPPVYITDDYKVDYGAKRGIYTRNGHMASRHACVQDMSAYFRPNVLVNTSSAYISGRASAFQHDKFNSREHDDNILWRALSQCSYSNAHRLRALKTIRSHLRTKQKPFKGLRCIFERAGC
jgi:glucuronyl/N-acetylglucosaminyl transferase EXT1/glucuronyl/N-acetylglucosaminyl transferase EXT2